MRPLASIVRCFAIVVVVASYAPCTTAQVSSCGKPDSIAVSIETSLDKDQMPFIVLSAKNISSRTLTCDEIESIEGGWFYPKFHIDGAQGVPSKSIWYRRLSHEYCYPDLATTVNVGCVAHLGKAQFAPGEIALFKYPLDAFYFFDKPGDYSAYLEVHDPEDTCNSNAKWLRTNTVQLKITPKQVETWESHAGTSGIHATINMRQTVIPLQQNPIVQIELRADKGISYGGDDFFPHVERDGMEIAKTTYFHERLHDPGTPQYEPFQGPKPDFPDTSRKSCSIEMQANQSSAWEIDLRNFYKFDTPGKYSVYIEFPDFSGKLLRSNTINFEISR